MNAPLQSSIASCEPVRVRSGTNWFWLGAAGLLAIVLAVPFGLVDVPPVLDYPNHLARYFVLAHPDDPVTSQMYAARWGILPNLGMDIIGAAVLRVTDVHVGGRLLLALSLFAPVIGVAAYHRAVFREWSWWPLASGLLAYNGAFFLGFMNFLLSLALAMMAAAIWVVLQRRNMPLIRIACGAVAATVLFFCHIFGVAFFALLIGTYEIGLLWNRRQSGALAASDILHAAGACVLALCPALVLALLSPLASVPASVGEWEGPAKLWRIFAPFVTSNAELTVITAFVVISLLVLFRRRVELAPGLPLALAGLLLVFAVTPSSLKGGTLVDLRAALMMGLLLFAGIRPRVTAHEAAFAGVAVGLLIALRSAQVGAAWFEHRHDLMELETAFANVEAGARVLPMRGRPGNLTGMEPEGRALPGIYRLDGHIGALLVSERRAFYPLLFADPAQQPLTVKPPFDRLAQPLGELANWQWLAAEALPPEALQRARYLEHWQRDFDYVLLIDAPDTVQSHRALLPLYRGSYAQLYRINRPDDEPRSARSIGMPSPLARP